MSVRRGRRHARYRLDSFATQMVDRGDPRRGGPRVLRRARRRGWPWTPTCSWTSGSCACHRARTPMNTSALPAGACATARPWPSWTPRMRTRVMRACWTRWARPAGNAAAAGAGRLHRVSPRFARLLDAFAARGLDIGQWRDAQRAPAQPRRRGPGSGAASGAPPRAGPRRNCRSIRQVATPSSRRSWKPNPCSPARAGPGAGRPRRRARAGSTWPWAGHWMNGRWRARRWPGCARWPNARTAAGCGADAGRAAGRPLRRRCARAFAPVRHRARAGGAMPISASARAEMAQAALDGAGGAQAWNQAMDIWTQGGRGQLRRVDAAHEGGP